MAKHNLRIIVLFITALLLSTTCVDRKKTTISDTDFIAEMTIKSLQEGYKTNKFTVSQIVETYLRRINEIDKNGPTLNSVIEINPDALTIAAALDKQISEGKITGPLFGVPVILKDNIDTHDNMHTTGGATALRNWQPQSDSQVAKKLREAGAVVIAKSNLSEWANFRAKMSSSGWSGVGGQTRNPYVLDRNPCGSSSGSGVAVSANLCMFAIGTETDGSICCPANNNGIVGIKPTVGLISRSGIIPISFSQDTPGPMTRTVEDAAMALGAMTGSDENDSKTVASVGKAFTDYTQFLKKDGLKNKRIGLLKSAMGFSDRVDSLMIKAIKDIKSSGAEVVEIEMPKTVDYGSASFTVLLYEFRDGLNKYLSQLPENSPVHNIKDLIRFNKSDSVELKYFDQNLLVEADKKGDLNSPEYKKALSDMLKGTRDDGIDFLVKKYNLDAIMAPAGSPAWKTDLILGDHFIAGNWGIPAIAGYPSITVPMGFVNDLPVDIIFFGKAWSEPQLIQVAYSYEQATLHRRAPAYRTTD